jgi:FMN reductase
MASLTVVGLGGSIATVSRSRAALQVALGGAAEAGAETKLLDLRELDLPMFNPEDDEPTPNEPSAQAPDSRKAAA